MLTNSKLFYFIEETQLKPLNVDFHKYENRIDHRTDDYESEELIIRRGQEFQVTVTFDRVYRPESDQIILQFATGLLSHLLTAL